MANKYLHRWVLVFCTSKSAASKLIKPQQDPSAAKLMEPAQDLSDYAWNMQTPARAAARHPHNYSCLPLQASRCLISSSPATMYSSSTDEGEYSANEQKEERSMREQQQLARSHSCSTLQAKLVPSFKSFLHRASSHSHVHNHHSQSCTLNDFAAADSRKQKGKRAPKGHVVIYVEAGRERHVVPIAYLNHPHFRALLERAESEFGLRQKGPGLRIPCSLSELHHILHQIRTQ